jgi:hypothetical protein
VHIISDIIMIKLLFINIKLCHKRTE